MFFSCENTRGSFEIVLVRYLISSAIRGRLFALKSILALQALQSMHCAHRPGVMNPMD